jgi:hypothetical protein
MKSRNPCCRTQCSVELGLARRVCRLRRSGSDHLCDLLLRSDNFRLAIFGKDMEPQHASGACDAARDGIYLAALLQTFWVFFGIMEGRTKGYVVSENVVMQIEASQDRRFQDVGDERVLRSDWLRLRFEGFKTLAGTPATLDG